MGIRLLSFGSSDTIPKFRLGEPQPHRFNTLDVKIVGKGVVVKLQYYDCTTYEGVKILVYDDFKRFSKMAKKKKGIDPHFLEKSYSPVARFEPTEKGWTMACDFAEKILSVH